MSIRKKILLGFTLVFIIGLILGVFGLVTAKRLTALANEQYELEEASLGVSNVLDAHYIWRQGITEAALSMGEFTGSLDPDTCALGKWKNSDEAKAISDPEILSLMEQLEQPHSFIHTEAREIVDLIAAGDRDEVQHVFWELILPKTEETISILNAMTERYAVLLEQEGAAIVAFGNTMTTVIIIVIVVAMFASLLLAFYIAGLISKPIAVIVGFLDKASAKGDFSIRPEDVKNMESMSKVKDEIGQMSRSLAVFVARIQDVSDALEKVADGDLTAELALLSDQDTMGLSLKKMVDNLNDMFGEIRTCTNQVTTGSSQVAGGSQSLAQGTTEQAASIQELSNAIAEIAEKTRDNAKMAAQAANLANTIKGTAETGSQKMGQMTMAVKEINEASRNINNVIKVIDDIAFQTNILALNAAVEAARAGEHGKGFSVVAEEVRNLAGKSAEAARETGDLIVNSIEKAELGTQIAGETAASLADIVSGINESGQLVGEIAKSSEEQSEGISQINISVDQVAQVVQQNSATAEESAAASEEISGQAEMLKQMTAQFKLKESESHSPSFSDAFHLETQAIPEETVFSSADGSGKGYGKKY